MQDKSFLATLRGLAKDNQDPDPTYFRSPIRYPGNKFSSLKHIIEVLPKATKFIDACGGSGVVTMNLANHYPLRVFNDRHAGVVAFFRCIRDNAKCEQLINRLDLTIHSREEFVWCRETWENCTEDVERAARWYYCAEHSFAGLGKMFGRQMNKSDSDDRLHSKLPLFRQVRARFAGVQVENLDVLTCLKDFCSVDSIAYIDPDYIDTDPGIYKHSVDHSELLDYIFSGAPGIFFLSGYKNQLYDSKHWDTVKTWEVSSPVRAKAFNENNGLADKEHVMSGNEIREEKLWVKDNR